MNRILVKAIVAQFYKINTGFFLVFFLLLFGMLNAQATIDLHYFLMKSIMTDYRFLLGAMAIWAVYNMKCLLYCHKELRNPANTYLYAMQALRGRRQFGIWALCHLQLFLPVLIYGLVAVGVGIKSGLWLFPMVFLAYQAGLCIASALVYCNTINSTWKQLMPPLPGIMKSVRKKPYTFLLHYSLNMRKGMFIGLKMLSLLLLQGMVAANHEEVNKESVAVLMMFLISAHCLLPVYYVKFAEARLSFLRNMPVMRANIFLTVAFTYAVMFLPEVLFLALNGQHALPPHVIAELYGVAISQMLLYTAVQYIPRINTDKYTFGVIGLFFATLLFLASFNLVLLIAVEVIIAITLYVLFYSRYELYDSNE